MTSVPPNATPTPCYDYTSCLAQALALSYQACLQNPPNGDPTQCKNISPTNPFSTTPLPSSNDPSDPCAQANKAFQTVALASVQEIESAFKANAAATAAAANALKVGSCTNANLAYGAQASAPFNLGSVGATANASFSTGCSQVALQMNMSTAINNSLNCVSNQIKASSTGNTIQANNLTINLTGVTSTGTLNLNVNQNLTSTGTVVNYTQATVQTQMKNAIQNALQQTNASLQSIANQGAPPSAQKSLASTMAATLNNAANLNMTQIMSSAGISGNQANTFTLSISQSDLNDLNLNVNQDAVQQYLCQNITKAVISSILDQSLLNSIQQSNQNQSSQASSSLPTLNLVGGAGGLAGIIIAIVIIICIAVGLWYYFSSKKTRLASP